MPQISRVVEPTNGQIVVANSVAVPDDPMSGAVSATRLKRATYSVVLYGKNRTGKTTLACLFPKPILIASYEDCSSGGAESIRGTPGVTVLRIRSRDHALRLAARQKSDPRSNWRLVNGTWQELVSDDGYGNQVPSFTGDQFQTYVTDSCTSLQDMILKEILGLDSLPVQLKFKQVKKEQYQDRSAQAKEVIQQFYTIQANTVFLALEKDFGSEENWGGQMSQAIGPTTHFAADMGEATVKWLNNKCDYICHLSVVPEVKRIETEVVVMPGDPPTKSVTLSPTGRTIHRLRTMFDPNYSAGFRSPVPENVPRWIECQRPQDMYDDMVRVMQGQRAVNGYYE